MVEVYNFIRASLLLRVERKQNVDLPSFHFCVNYLLPRLSVT